MSLQPLRGPAVRTAGLALPPARMPLRHGSRPLKRWRWVGVFTPTLALCVAQARVGPLPQHWWAVALPDGRLFGATTFREGGVELAPGQVRVRTDEVAIDLRPTEGAGVECLSPASNGYLWTRKQLGVKATGDVQIAGTTFALDGPLAVIDDSAGYHDRHTAWRWSTGVGTLADGRPVAWNLVAGIHDAAAASERTVCVDGEPHEVGPVAFDDLRRIRFEDGDGELLCEHWAQRTQRTNAGLLRLRYRQPFGSFAGELPGGLELAEGVGVMEDHDVWW